MKNQTHHPINYGSDGSEFIDQWHRKLVLSDPELTVAEVSRLFGKSFPAKTVETVSGSVVFLVDGSFVIQYLNQNFKDILFEAYGVEVDKGLNLLDCIDCPDDRTRMSGLISRTFAGETVTSVDTFGKLNKFFFDAHLFPVKDNCSLFIGAVMSLENIAQKVQMQPALKELDNKFKTIFDHSVIAKSITGIDGQLNVNKAFCQLVGYTQEELNVRNWRDISHPDDISQNEYEIESILSGKKKYSHWGKRYIHKNGEIIWTEICTYLQRDEAGQPLYFITEVVDVSSKKRAEKKLTEAQALYQDLFDNAPIGYHELDAAGCIVQMNSTELAMLGYGNEEVLGKPFWELVLDKESAKAAIQAKLSRIEIPDGSLSCDLVRKDGLTLSVLLNNKLLCDKSGLITGIRTAVQDVSQHNQSLNTIKKNEEQHKAILHAALDGFWVVDATGKILEVNERYIQMSGYSADELTQMSISDLDVLVSPEDIINKIRELEVKGSNRFETKHRRKDGSVLDIEVSVFYQKSAEINIVTFLRDITQRKMDEEVLLKYQHLLSETEALGKVGGWEFDINTRQMFWTKQINIIHELPENYSMTIDDVVRFNAPGFMVKINEVVQRAIHLHESFEIDLEIITACGNLRSLHALGMFDPQKERLFGYIQDITQRKIIELELQERMDELMRFQHVTVGRELAMIDLKKEINMLYQKIGQEPRYLIVE